MGWWCGSIMVRIYSKATLQMLFFKVMWGVVFVHVAWDSGSSSQSLSQVWPSCGCKWHLWQFSIGKLCIMCTRVMMALLTAKWKVKNKHCSCNIHTHNLPVIGMLAPSASGRVKLFSMHFTISTQGGTLIGKASEDFGLVWLALLAQWWWWWES